MTDYQAEVDEIAQISVVPTILDVVCKTTGMGFAAVARVTEDRWIACSVQDGIAFGLRPGGELKIETTICSDIRHHLQPVIIDNVAEDEIYCHHHTPAMYGFQSYISMPITLPDGTFFGTLCAIDPSPRMVNTPATIGLFRLFAELIAFHLDAHRRVAGFKATLLREREVSELREQFIAVLGHDLRNPLASITAGTRLLRRHPERALEIAGHIEKSSSRMAGLIDDVLDFARGRLGGGFVLHRDTEKPLAPTLIQVVDELRSSHPERRIDVDIALAHPVDCDPARVAQVLSNLLANALTHSSAERPIRVKALTQGGDFTLTVANGGEPIPPATMENLFQPFFRGGTRASQEGLGLGLYIASEIARAHGGRIDVTSTPDETCFTLRMPVLGVGALRD